MPGDFMASIRCYSDAEVKLTITVSIALLFRHTSYISLEIVTKILSKVTPAN